MLRTIGQVTNELNRLVATRRIGRPTIYDEGVLAACTKDHIFVEVTPKYEDKVLEYMDEEDIVKEFVNVVHLKNTMTDKVVLVYLFQPII